MGRPRPRLDRLVLVSVTVLFVLLIISRLLFGSSFFVSLSLSYTSNMHQGKESSILVRKNNKDNVAVAKEKHDHYCTAADHPNNTICCDRTSSSKFDICFMRGDIRTLSTSSSIFLYNSSMAIDNGNYSVLESIQPYPRKWETGIMATVEQLNLVATRATGGSHKCDVNHSVPAVVFYTGGYTGNLYHEFNDGIVPLYITTQHFNKQVVIVILKYRTWWISKYLDILSQLSDYPPIDFSGDHRTHCFPSAIVGVRVHDELSINPSKMEGNKTIFDFRRLLDDAYRPRIRRAFSSSQRRSPTPKPKLVLISRNGSRGVENEHDLVNLCKRLGFQVQVLRPKPTTDLAQMYSALNGSDVMVGVHGAALTHFLFLRPGSVFIQIVPLGIDWVAETCFGRAAEKMGLKYMKYGIAPEESSLYREYEKDSPVVRQPKKVAKEKGWKVTKEVYLEGQSVRLNVKRFRRWLVGAYLHALSRKN